MKPEKTYDVVVDGPRRPLDFSAEGLVAAAILARSLMAMHLYGDLSGRPRIYQGAAWSVSDGCELNDDEREQLCELGWEQ